MADTIMDAAEATKVDPLQALVLKRGIQEAQWVTLRNSLFPGADPRSVLLVWDYCKARGLDPMKKPCHIVPMRVKDARTERWEWRDVVMPGIYEFRTTAHRTGEYLGHSKPEYGPEIELHNVKAPEYCDLTIFRFRHGQKVEFPVRCYFREVAVVIERDGTKRLNDRWSRAPIQMLTKCTEAAGLREGFPEELGGEHTDDELDGRTLGPDGPVVRDITPDPFLQVPEGMRDPVEQAFAALRLTAGQRLQKLTEYMGRTAATPEENAKALLVWCHEASAPQATPKPKGDTNGKGHAKAAHASPSSSVATVGAVVADVPREDGGVGSPVGAAAEPSSDPDRHPAVASDLLGF